jgi:hypothetical protein
MSPIKRQLGHVLRRVCEATDAPPPATQAVVLYGMDLSAGLLLSWLPSFLGPIYAVSVGLVGTMDVAVFDRVYARTEADLGRFVMAGCSEANVGLVPDMGWLGLPGARALPQSVRPFMIRPRRSGRPLLGVCLKAAQVDVPWVSTLLGCLSDRYEVCLIACDPDDSACNDNLARADRRLHALNAPELQTLAGMWRLFSTLNAVVSMHHEASLFATKMDMPCIAMHTSFLPNTLHLQVNTLTTDPQATANGMLAYLNGRRMGTITALPMSPEPTINAAATVRACIANRIRKRIPVPQAAVASVAAATQTLTSLLCRYLGLEEAVIGHWLVSGHQERLLLTTEQETEVARMFSFALSNKVGVRGLGELHSALFGPARQRPIAVLAWLRDNLARDCATMHQQDEEYCAGQGPSGLQVPIDLSMFDQHDCGGLHRWGWAWALQGLYAYDGKACGRQSRIMVDAYLDRSMSYGYETLKAAGILPYTRPWAGFVHHTLGSGVACMLGRPLLLESLKSCKCLFVLSRYMANCLRTELATRGHAGVKIFVLHHPMPLPPPSKMFDVTKFLSNPNRKVVQVGAWLRNTWSIFSLGISPRHGDFAVTKAALIGPEMDSYYKPAGLFDSLKQVLAPASAPPPANAPCDALCRIRHRHTNPSNRPTPDALCRAQPPPGSGNAYSLGMFDMLEAMDESVQLLPQMTNDEFDELIGGRSEAIVFLDLSDASAVNTVLECVVRATPLIINRHPAVEEVLGRDYPGLYDDLVQAASMVTSMQTVLKAHLYLLALPKDRFSIKSVLDEFQAALASTMTTEDRL